VNNNINKTFDKFLIELLRKDPSYQRAFEGKTWLSPAGSPPVKSLQQAVELYWLAKCHARVSEGYRERLFKDTGMATFMVVMERAHDYDFPFFYVQERIVEAVLHTEPPVIDLKAHPMPFPGFFLIFPRGTFDDPDMEIIGVANAMTNDGREGFGVAGFRITNHEEGEIFLTYAALPVVDGKVDLAHFEDARDTPIFTAMQACFTTWAILEARPDLREEPRVKKTYTDKHKKKRSVVVPRMIGRVYSVAQQDEHAAKGTRHVRTHWRRGHFHTVCYGKKRQQRRLRWYEPMIINAK
jgi:hypothetical protein